MSEDYVTAKIHEALKATGDDKKDAQKLLITWAVRDQALLLGLSKPHLKALVSARIEQSLRGEKKKDGDAGDLKKNVDAIILSRGKNEKRTPVKVPPPKTSERQASVMHQIAAAFRKRK